MKATRIFQEPDGFHWSSTTLPHLDARGRAYATKSEALRAAYGAGYTHAYGCAAGRRSIRSLVSLDELDHTMHRHALAWKEANA